VKRRTRRAAVLFVSAVVLVMLAAGGVYAWVGATVAAGFGAKVTCSCVFVSMRPEPTCVGDELDAQGMSWLRVRVHRLDRTVTATALGLRTAHASFREGLGCTLE
jgi:hypothetical protein